LGAGTARVRPFSEELWSDVLVFPGDVVMTTRSDSFDFGEGGRNPAEIASRFGNMQTALVRRSTSCWKTRSMASEA
jgi:hypothetical protein